MGIAPDYVLDRMQPYEIAALLEHAWMRSRESWEQTRFLAYIYAQSLCKKELKLSDLLPFAWDGEEATPETGMEEKERQRLTELAKQYEKKLCQTQVS